MALAWRSGSSAGGAAPPPRLRRPAFVMPYETDLLDPGNDPHTVAKDFDVAPRRTSVQTIPSLSEAASKPIKSARLAVKPASPSLPSDDTHPINPPPHDK